MWAGRQAGRHEHMHKRRQVRTQAGTNAGRQPATNACTHAHRREGKAASDDGSKTLCFFQVSEVNELPTPSDHWCRVAWRGMAMCVYY